MRLLEAMEGSLAALGGACPNGWARGAAGWGVCRAPRADLADLLWGCAGFEENRHRRAAGGVPAEGLLCQGAWCHASESSELREFVCWFWYTASVFGLRVAKARQRLREARSPASAWRRGRGRGDCAASAAPRALAACGQDFDAALRRLSCVEAWLSGFSGRTPFDRAYPPRSA